MKVTRVLLRMIQHPRLKAIACVTLNDAVIIDDIKVIQAKNRLCIMYPQNEKNQCIVSPKTLKTSKKIEQAILGKYAALSDWKGENESCTQIPKCASATGTRKIGCAENACPGPENVAAEPLEKENALPGGGPVVNFRITKQSLT